MLARQLVLQPTAFEIVAETVEPRRTLENWAGTVAELIIASAVAGSRSDVAPFPVLNELPRMDHEEC